MFYDFLCEVFIPIRVWLCALVLTLLVNLVENIDGIFVIVVVRAQPHIRVFCSEVDALIRVIEAQDFLVCDFSDFEFGKILSARAGNLTKIFMTVCVWIGFSQRLRSGNKTSAEPTNRHCQVGRLMNEATFNNLLRLLVDPFVRRLRRVVGHEHHELRIRIFVEVNIILVFIVSTTTKHGVHRLTNFFHAGELTSFLKPND